jgi:DUF4097 and DUF4098 domain-containing protein YvlB
MCVWSTQRVENDQSDTSADAAGENETVALSPATNARHERVETGHRATNIAKTRSNRLFTMSLSFKISMSSTENRKSEIRTGIIDINHTMLVQVHDQQHGEHHEQHYVHP